MSDGRQGVTSGTPLGGYVAGVLDGPADDPDRLRAAAEVAGRGSRWTDQLAADLRADGGALRDGWDGPASRACAAELARVVALVGALPGPLHAASLLVRSHAEVVAQGERDVTRLRRAYDDLVTSHRRGLAVALAGPDLPGGVRGLHVRELAVAHERAVATVRAEHRAVLDRVGADAARTATALGRLVAGALPRQATGDRREAALVASLPLLAETRRSAGAGELRPPTGAPPPLVQAWWSSLTPDEQERAIRRSPATVGNLDGLTGAVRTRANELRLARDVVELAGLECRSEEEQRWLDTALLVRGQLARVRRDGGPGGSAQLLVFRPRAFGGEGRVAIAVGDSDTADHVAVLVPGLGSDVLSAVPGLTSDALAVRSAARAVGARRDVAVVAWMGYDAPRLADAAVDAAARDGARLLTADLLALQSAREVAPHLTVVGHSYGSTTVGVALRDHVTGVDDVVLLGSPGPAVDAATELQVPAGHVFAGASSRDPVSYLDRFGSDPTHADFGAVRFRAEDPTRNRWMLDLADHGKYLDPGTESLDAVAHVVAGDYTGVRVAPYREEVWLLPDGITSDPEAGRDPSVD